MKAARATGLGQAGLAATVAILAPASVAIVSLWSPLALDVPTWHQSDLDILLTQDRQKSLET